MSTVKEILYRILDDNKLVVVDVGILTAVGSTSVIEIGRTYNGIAWQIVNDATATAPTIRLEGSIDGVVWVTIDTSSAIGTDVRQVSGVSVKYLRVVVDSLGDGTNVGIKILIN